MKKLSFSLMLVFLVIGIKVELAEALPDIRGEYYGSYATVVTSCSDSASNGTYNAVLEMSISTQTGNTFSGTATGTINIDNSALIGGWFYNPGTLAESGVLTIIDDTNYMFVVDGEPDGGGGRGMERGTYSWNSTTGAFTATAISKTLGDWGVSSLGEMTISVNENILNIIESIEGPFSLTKISSESNPIVGSWFFNPGSLADSAVLTFIDGTNYMFAVDGEPDGGGGRGMERGTYTWSSTTGAFTATAISGTAGDWGISYLTDPTVSIEGNTLTIIDSNDGPIPLTKVEGFAPVEYIQLSGTITEAGQVSGTTSHTFLGTGGEGTFTGQLSGNTLSIVNPGQDTYGDTCNYTRTMSATRAGIPPIPISSEWVAENSMLEARDQFTGGVIGGKIYVFGGNGNPDGINLKSTEMFDPATHLWTYKSSNENNNGQGVEELTGAVFNDKLYVFGAYGGGTPYGVFNFVQEYDPATDTWTSKAPKPTVVSGATAAVYDGEIFLFGGGNTSDTDTYVRYDIVEAYNPTSNTWRTVTIMPYALGMMSIGVVGTKAYLIGGLDYDTYNIQQNVIAYDFESNQWTTNGLGTLPTPRFFSYASSAPIVDGKIYQIGGMIPGADVYITNDVLVYDPSTQSFKSAPPLPQVTDSLLTLSKNDSIYAIGGEIDRENNISTNAVWRLDLAPKPNVIPMLMLLLDDGSPKIEEWDLVADGGSGQAYGKLKKSAQGLMTIDGEFIYNYYTYEVRCPWVNGTVVNDGNFYTFNGSGTASMSLGSSSFDLVIQGTFNNGSGTGTYEITFSSLGWPSKVEGNWTGTRTSGNGITP